MADKITTGAATFVEGAYHSTVEGANVDWSKLIEDHGRQLIDLKQAFISTGGIAIHALDDAGKAQQRLKEAASISDSCRSAEAQGPRKVGVSVPSIPYFPK